MCFFGLDIVFFMEFMIDERVCCVFVKKLLWLGGFEKKDGRIGNY